jgi:hypothetical protein
VGLTTAIACLVFVDAVFVDAVLVGAAADEEEEGGDPHGGQEKANGRDETVHGVLPTGVVSTVKRRTDTRESRGGS